MSELLINIFVYTFAVFGVISFFIEINKIFGLRKSKSKILLIPDKDCERIEGDLKSIYYSLGPKGDFECLYIVSDSLNDERKAIIEKLCEDNSFYVEVDKQKAHEMIG